jgi:predicted acylesterase/phospholipase RssA/ABC-type phosphate/phosphonate transport system substrate-binding protein
MKFRNLKSTVTLSFVSLVSLAFFQPGLPGSSAQSIVPGVKAPTVIKVGITEYQNLEDSYDRYETLFAALQQSADKNEPVSFSFAIGNYGEVMDWYNNGLIDVAILSAMPVAGLLANAGTEELKKIDEAYVGDISVTRPRPKLATEQSVMSVFPAPKQQDPYRYRAGAIVLKSDTEIHTLNQVKKLAAQKQVQFLFVRPFSLSGYIIPLAVLHANGIYPTPDEIKFTYQHKNSLLKLLDAHNGKTEFPGKHLIAFVLDATTYPAVDGGQEIFKHVAIPALDDDLIPREIVLANYHLEKDKLDKSEGYKDEFQKHRALITRLFEKQFPNGKSADDSEIAIAWRKRTGNWRGDYLDSQEAIKSVEVPRELRYKSTISELLDGLAKNIEKEEMDRKEGRLGPNQKGKLPRLALVLSGGGAKCAYQAGAIVEIEKKLKELNADLDKKLGPVGKPRLDINLVVGTSGGAINALLVALGVTNHDKAPEELAKMWGSFRQQQFFQPSRRFNLVFGLCFGLLQALLITVAVLMFGRESMNWSMTILVLGALALAQVITAIYFRASGQMVAGLLLAELVFVLFIIGIVAIFDYSVNRFGAWWHNRKLLRGTATAAAGPVPNQDVHHWRKLTIVLMLTFSLVELVVATVSGVELLISKLSNSHWVEHIWMLVVLICNWSFPYPLIIGLIMALTGWIFWRTFEWNRHRKTFVWLLTVVLIFFAGALVLEGLFRTNAPSKALGIEQAFAQQIPALIQQTVNLGFTTPETNEPLKNLSLSILNEASPMLQRDLVITTSRLPMTPAADGAALVNSLPPDLYFYFRHNQDEELKPPLDKRFVPFKYNRDKLLDVVIGSSTIYPIFPSRILRDVVLGNEEVSLVENRVKKMNIIDGGYIHNIPMEAAGLWKASHIILIEASPQPQESEPRHFWDNALMAFSYLFSQAQRSDKLARGKAETFELRPTSKCEKQDVRTACPGKDNPPEPDMDTFDFSRHLVNDAFEAGQTDVRGLPPGIKLPPDFQPAPLFERVSGPPNFRELTTEAQRQLGKRPND